MKNSRELADLHPLLQVKASRLIEQLQPIGIELVIVSTLRDEEAQNALYALGRAEQGPNPTPKQPRGSIVTDNSGGYSFHQYGLAFDAWPLVNGRLVTTFPMPDWLVWATIKEACAVRGVSLVMAPKREPKTHAREWWHFQYTAGLTIEDVRRGATLPGVQL
jgi:peptidoglycan L-alanyl-D-glutamate endopeptidase CwlK